MAEVNPSQVSSTLQQQVSGLQKGAGLKNVDKTEEESFTFTKFDDLTKEQQDSLITHFTNTEGYIPNGHLVTEKSGITFGSGIDVKAVTTEKSLIKHGISKEDAKIIIDGLKYTKKDGTEYNMAGKTIKKIKSDLDWTQKELKEHVEKIKFTNTTKKDIISSSVDDNFDNNSDILNKVSNFEDFTVLSSLIHFTGDSHLESDVINRNTGGNTKRAMQIGIYELLNKYDDNLTKEEFHNVLQQIDKIAKDKDGIGTVKGSATRSRMVKEINYSKDNSVGSDFEFDETKYYTIDLDDLGTKGSSDKKSLTIHDATYVEPKTEDDDNIDLSVPPGTPAEKPIIPEIKETGEEPQGFNPFGNGGTVGLTPTKKNIRSSKIPKSPNVPMKA